MAQYIEAPGFSYDPLPMEQYVQFAKEQALAYEGSLNSAYEFLDKLPILDGGLRTEGWAQQLRQEYGSQVQKAIDNFVDTKDRRALARELSAISTRLKTDNDLLVNNYDARAAAPTMQLFQTQPNGANSFTRSGTMQPVNRYQDPETGEIVEENNFIQFQRGQTSLQDAERSYNDYVGAYDIINDTKFMTTNLFNEIQSAIGSKIIEDPNQPGVLLVQTDTGVKKFNNTLELVQDPDAMGEYYQASQEAINQLRVQWDQNQSDTVRAYKYRGLSFQDYVNDAFSTTMPKLHLYGQSTNVTARNAPKGGGNAGVTPEKLAELIVEGVETDARTTAELDIARYLDASDMKKYNLLVQKARENGYTVNDLLSGNFPESEEFIELSEKLVTKAMMDAQLNDPTNQEAIRQANIDFDASEEATNFGLRKFAADNPGVNGDIPEEMFKWYTSIGANLGLYGEDELFGMELEDYDFTRVTDWGDQFLDPFADGDSFDRTASPVAVQVDVLREGLKNFGPGLDGTIPMLTPESYEAILEAKANGAEDVTSVEEHVNQEFHNLVNPTASWFVDENVGVVRENLTYDQAVERGLVPETIQTVFETQGDQIRYNAGDFGNPEFLNEFIQARNSANPIKSDIIKEANKFEVYTPKVRITPTAQIQTAVNDQIKNGLIKRLSLGESIGTDFQIYVVDRDEDNSVPYGPRSLTGSGYNYMRDITALSEGGGLSSIFFGKGSDQKEAQYTLEGAVAGVGAGQKSGLVLDVNLRDTDSVSDDLVGYFSPGKSTRLLIVPKSNTGREQTFGWIDDYRSKLTTSYAPSISTTGLFGTGMQSGDQMRQLLELGNKLNVFNLLMPLNSQAAMKKEGVPITNTYLNPQQGQNMGFAVVFDPYRPVGNTTPGRQGVQLSEVYAAKHEDGDGAAWTWQEYFSNRTDESPIMLEEALLAANSQQLSEDYSPEELGELVKTITEAAYTNQNGYKVIKLGDFKDLFKRAGLDYNLNKGILFHNKFDLATFTSMINPEAALAE